VIKILIVNGTAKSGKDTFCEWCDRYLKSVGCNSINISSVDEVKEYGERLGWDGEKDDKGRKFLSDLKELSTRYNGPERYISKQIASCDGLYDIIFIHIREPDAISSLVKQFPHAKTILLMRGDIVFNNSSDKEVFDYSYDYYIDNQGTIDDLCESAISVMDDILLRVFS